MPRPKLIFINRVYWPSEAATAQLLTDLAEGLASRGREVHVIAAGGGAMEHHGVTIHRAGPFDRHQGLLSQYRNYHGFVRAAGQILDDLAEPGDVVVLKTDPPLLGAALTQRAQRRGARVVLWLQDIYPEILAGYAGAWLSPLLLPLRARRDRAWRAAEACVVVGGDMTGLLRNRKVPPEHIHVLPNWAPRELSVPAQAADIAAARAQVGAATDFIVAYSGNLGRVHEFDTLLEAAHRLGSTRGVVFAFIGQGPRLGEVQARAQELALANVRFLPPYSRAHLAAGLAAADAHVVSLRPEFTGLVNPSKLAGIAAVGRPILFVGKPRGANPDLLAQEDCGLTIAAGDAAALATEILRLRDEPGLAARLGRNARACYERHFTFSAALERWEQLLDARGSPATPDLRPDQRRG